ncbi:hypothetical protein ACFLXA_02840 [Chloroflexota bacterium]
MESRVIVIPYTNGEIFKLHPISDEHTGTKYCAEDTLIAKHKEILKDPYSFWIQIGDKVEAITPSDVRYEQKALADWIKDVDDIPNEQARHYCEIVRPSVEAKIKDTDISKCLGSGWGNHEWTVRKKCHNNVQKTICDSLKIEDLGYTCIYHIIFRRENSTESHMFKGAFTHGSGNAQTRGGKLNKLRKFMNQINADFYCYAHMHDIIIETKPILETNKDGKIIAKEAPGAVTGCYYRTYTQDVISSYGEMRGYDPVPIGSPIFYLDPQHSEVTVSKGIKSNKTELQA